jgi:hypothetical protein
MNLFLIEIGKKTKREWKWHDERTGVNRLSKAYLKGTINELFDRVYEFCHGISVTSIV